MTSFKCPYCNHEHLDAEELQPYHDKFECDNCGEAFALSVDTKIVTNTVPLYSEAGGDTGE